MVGPLRKVRVLLLRPVRRAKRYIEECKESFAPMPNPPGYEEEPERTWSSYTLQQHADSWKNGIRYWYRSFNSDLYEKDGYLDDPKPKKGGEVEKEEAKDDLVHLPEDTRKQLFSEEEFQKKLEEIKKGIKYDLTPEEVQKYRAEFMEDLKQGQGSLKQFAEERLDLFRLTIKEFLNGYKEGREEDAEQVRKALKDQVDALKGMFQQGELTPESIEARKQENLRIIKEMLQEAMSLSSKEKEEVQREVAGMMKEVDAKSTAEEVERYQKKVEQFIGSVRTRIKERL